MKCLRFSSQNKKRNVLNSCSVANQRPESLPLSKATKYRIDWNATVSYMNIQSHFLTHYFPKSKFKGRQSLSLSYVLVLLCERLMYADCKPIIISVLRDVYVCRLRGAKVKKKKRYRAARSFLSCVKCFSIFSCWHCSKLFQISRQTRFPTDDRVLERKTHNNICSAL